MSIKIENLSYIYDQGMPFETIAVDNISFDIENGEFVGIIGHTGSGKSTLIQTINGLYKPSKGKIFINDIDLTDKKVKKSDIRKKVGLVFQYPEYQLFEETVYKDIAFGPKNLNLKADEIDIRVKESMKLVGLDFEKLNEVSPFELSGGQKRRVAIAGVLAMNPEVLILDEPTAGLDPKARDEILKQIEILNKKKKVTVLLVSHSMEEVANLVDRLIVLDKGKKVLDGDVRSVFKEYELLTDIGLGVPQVTELINKLNLRGCNIKETVLNVEEAKNAILKQLRGDSND
ncbi:energy-coupling factor transporter ATPase [Clostridiaceae bacterium HSG29]|nr:energy-coupling factor transporter ATPase [Clostridiaceae bacterium HSG29]